MRRYRNNRINPLYLAFAWPADKRTGFPASITITFFTPFHATARLISRLASVIADTTVSAASTSRLAYLRL